MADFDSLRFAQDLKGVEFPSEQAERLTSLIRDYILADAVKTNDLANTEKRLDEKINRLEERITSTLTSELKQLEQKMTIRLGTMIAAAIAIVVAAQKLV